ncbi:MAG: gamma-glutamyltransferase, partial [Myxococcota bacterium]
ATALVISVVEPYSAGIGGGGFLVLRLAADDAIESLDFREKAPHQARRDMYLGEDGQVVPGRSVDGYLSVAVPGTVAGLAEVHKKHGRRPWRTLVQPAIRIAEEGFLLDEVFVQALERRQEPLLRYPAGRALFAPKGQLRRAGERFRQPELAKTLRRIAKDPTDFYTGATARAVVADMERNGGLVTAADLANYAPQWREPVCGDFRAHRVCSMPPPSSGGVHLIEILNLLEKTPLKTLGWNSVDGLHAMIEAMRIAYADRAEHLGDPAFWKVPVSELTSIEYARLRAKEISLERVRASTEVVAATNAQLQAVRHESNDTTHLTVVDKERNAVALTFTVNYGFGSGVIVPGTGVLLNDEMDDFAAAPGVPNSYGLVGGEANAVQPGKIPLSSMTPFVVTREGRLVLAGGSPGGSTIITTSLQLVLNVIEHQMDAAAAVAAPRIHHQWLPDTTLYEPFGLDVGTRRDLEARGHSLSPRDRWGNASAIVLTEEGWLEGAADPRGVGTAAGF